LFEGEATKWLIYEGKPRGGDDASIQLLARGDGWHPAACIAGQRRWKTTGEMGQTGRFGRMGRLGSWAGEGFRAKFKVLNRSAFRFDF
jgi:hypothetical protein